MSRFQRSLRLLLGIVVLLVVVVAGSGLYYFRVYLPQSVAPRSFPQVEGEIQLPVKQTVEIYRDKMGIPHIYASTMYDLFLPRDMSMPRIASGRWTSGDISEPVGFRRCSAKASLRRINSCARSAGVNWLNRNMQCWVRIPGRSSRLMRMG